MARVPSEVTNASESLLPRFDAVADDDNGARDAASYRRVEGEAHEVDDEYRPLAFSEVAYEVGGKRVLQCATGLCPAKSLSAIMGSSGAGKTTLLDVLAQRTQRGGRVTAGQILRPCDPARFGYVLQDDVLVGALTVEEMLAFGVELRLRCARGKAIVHARRVAKLLRLERVADQRIGTLRTRGISGGERRRVSIGLELASRPKLLFVDEGTTGLDSVSALVVTAALKRIAASGTAVVITLHQPSSNIFVLFDALILLAAGRTCYCGAASATLPYFDAALGLACPPLINPADFLLDILSFSGRDPALAEEIDLDIDDDDDEAADLALAPAAASSTADEHAVLRRNGGGGSQRWAASHTTQDLHATFIGSALGQELSQTVHAELQRGPSGAVGVSVAHAHRCGFVCAGCGGAVCEWMRSIATLSRRTLLATLRDPGVLAIRTLAAVAIGALTGIVFCMLSRASNRGGPPAAPL